MAVFVELTTDAFEEVLSSQSARRTADGRSAGGGRRIARRPTRGLEIKEDTPAAIKVIQADGTELPLVDSSSATGTSTSGYSNFILQSVTEARMEKHQIVETFGASYIFFFGESPRFLDISAVVVNSHDFNWEAEWWENYENNFRGTKLVERGARLFMFYDDNVVEGYMIMSQAAKVSDQPHLIQLSYRLFLTGYRNVSFIGSPQFPIHASSVVTEEADLATKNQSGTSRDTILSDGQPDRGSQLIKAISGGSLSQAPSLSELLRNKPATGAIDPQVKIALDRLGNPSGGNRNGLPLRSLIAANLDEFIGLSLNQISTSGFVSSGVFTNNAQSAMTPADRAHLESDNLHNDAISTLGEQGADINSPSTLKDMGLQANFSAGAKAGATAGASFRPKEGASFGFGTGAQTQDNPIDSTSRFSKDPLGAIYGGTSETDRLKDDRFDEGVGDSEYGYNSEFSSGPGFAKAGFGDFGGPGYGSAQGASGDPGFRNPSAFTFRGVVANKAAFAKFRKPKSDPTTFGKGNGLGASSSGLTGGAAVKIQGKPSAFSLVSVGGALRLHV